MTDSAPLHCLLPTLRTLLNASSDDIANVLERELMPFLRPSAERPVPLLRGFAWATFVRFNPFGRATVRSRWGFVLLGSETLDGETNGILRHGSVIRSEGQRYVASFFHASGEQAQADGWIVIELLRLGEQRSELTVDCLHPRTIDYVISLLGHIAHWYPEAAQDVGRYVEQLRKLPRCEPVSVSGSLHDETDLLPWHREALKLWRDGCTEAGIAKSLGQEPKTVHNLIPRLRQRLGAANVPLHNGPSHAGESGPISGRSGP